MSAAATTMTTLASRDGPPAPAANPPAAPAAAPAATQQRAPLLFRAYDVVERVQKPGKLGKRKRRVLVMEAEWKKEEEATTKTKRTGAQKNSKKNSLFLSGLVWRVAGESESEFDDEEDYSDDDYSDDFSDEDDEDGEYSELGSGDLYFSSEGTEEEEEGQGARGARSPPQQQAQQQQQQQPAATNPHAAANHHHNHQHSRRGVRSLLDGTAEVAWLPWKAPLPSGGNVGDDEEGEEEERAAAAAAVAAALQQGSEEEEGRTPALPAALVRYAAAAGLAAAPGAGESGIGNGFANPFFEPDAPTVERLGTIRVVDRGLIAGDVVARSADPLGMTGVVLSVERLVDVEVSRTTLIPATPSPEAAARAVASSSTAAAVAVAAAAKKDSKIVKSVPASLLGPVLRFCPDQHVIHRERGWLGRVAHVDEVITLRFADGVCAEVRPREPGGKPLDDAGILLPTTKADAALSDGHRCPFYPGQVVDARSVAALRSEARLRIVPLPGSNGNAARGGAAGQQQGHRVRALRATVLKVEADELEVDWIAPLPAMTKGAPHDGDGEGEEGEREEGRGGGGARGLIARLVGGVRGNTPRDSDPDDDSDGFDGSSGLPRSMRLPPDVVLPRHCEPVDRHFFDPAYWHLGTRGLWLGEWGEEEEVKEVSPQQKKSKKKKKKTGSSKREEDVEGATAAAGVEAEAAAAASDREEEAAASRSAAAAAGGLGFVAAMRSAVAALLPSAAETETGTSAPGAEPSSAPAPASAAAVEFDFSAAAAPAAAGVATVPATQQQQMTRRASAGRAGRRGARAAPARPSASAPAVASSGRAASHRSTLPPLPPTALVVRTQTRAVVAWQDGTISDEKVGNGGSCENGGEEADNSDRGSIPASRLLPITHLDDHDFWPDDFVIERLDDDDESDDEEDGKKKQKRVPRSGVIVSSDPKARTAKVVFWAAASSSYASQTSQHRPLPAITDEDAAERAETVPVYSIRPHRDFAFANGDVVVRLGASGAAAAAAAAAAALVATQEGTRSRGAAIRVDIDVGSEGEDEAEGGGESGEVEKEKDGAATAEAAAAANVTTIATASSPPSPPLGSIGEVVGLRRGRVRVSWVRVGGVIVGGGGRGRNNAAPSPSSSSSSSSPFETLEPPNELFVLSRDDDDDGGGFGDSEYEDEYVDDEAGGAARGGAAAAAAAAATARGREEASSESDEDDEEEEEAEEEEEETAAAAAALPPPSTSAVPAASAPAAAAGKEEPEKAAGDPLPPPYSFPRFEVLEGEPPADHIYLREGLSSVQEGGSAPPPPRKWSKAVLKEWEGLRAGLEEGERGGEKEKKEEEEEEEEEGEGDAKRRRTGDSSSSSAPTIWVRAWESRLDLLRCAIAGPPGTPYHDHLFLFDLCLPRDYPNSPPKVSYHAFGLRVNPNLYDTGKVCLSLLGTWSGRQGSSEVWNPEGSTLLQVLVSIQGLVLVKEPYYNEAGYEKRVGSAEGAKGSRLYSESAFLLSCRSALRLTKRPPAPLGGLVRSFYRHHRERLFESCGAYLRNEIAVGEEEEKREEAKGEGASATSATTAAAATATNQGGEDNTSEGFRLALEQLLPRLRAGLDSIE